MTVQGSARKFPTLLTGFFGRNSLLTKWFPNNWITRKTILTNGVKGDYPINVDWVSGACMVVRRNAVEDIGLMDERFFMYWEDVDWCKRMWQKGWKIVYYPKASILHYIGGSSEKNVYQSVLEFHKSAYYFSGKHLKPSMAVLKPLFYFTFATAIFSRFLLVLSVKALQKPFCNLSTSPRTDKGPCN